MKLTGLQEVNKYIENLVRKYSLRKLSINALTERIKYLEDKNRKYRAIIKSWEVVK